MSNMNLGELERPSQEYYSSSTVSTSVNGVTETTHTVKDSRNGIEKVSVKRKLGDKSHHIEKTKNLLSGHEQTIKKLSNIQEDDEDHFDREWKQKARVLHDFSFPSRSRNMYSSAIETHGALTAPVTRTSHLIHKPTTKQQVTSKKRHEK